MEITTVRGSELTAEQRRLWERFAASDPALAGSPCVSSEFTAAVAAVREDVHVGLLREGGETVGFFPFQRDAMGDGAPAGHPLSDLHGVVAAPGASWTVEELLRGCGLRSWEFNHLPVGQAAGQAPFQPWHQAVFASPCMDLSGGYAAYAGARRAAGSRLIPDAARLRRRLERERGPVRCEVDATDPAVLERLMALKSAQYLRTGSYDRFAIPWIADLLRNLLRQRGEGLAGQLSALWVDGELAAAHMGIRSREVLHWWFPVYDRRFERYSPGILLLLAVAERAPDLGIRRIDLGRDRTPEPGLYKRSLASGSFQVAQGRAQLLRAT